MILVAACPGGNVSNFMSHLCGGNTALSVSLTAIATLLAVLMTPLNLQFWGSLYGPSAALLTDVQINLWEMVRLVALLLGLPLIAGMLLGHLRPKLAKRMAKLFKIVSLLFFVFLIFVALYNNRDIFLDYVGLVFTLVLFHNISAFLLGYTSGRVMRLPFRDVKSITIETGIQNSGLGLLLIFTFFEGLGGMALLAAFWGIWHLVSGLALSALWGVFRCGRNLFYENHSISSLQKVYPNRISLLLQRDPEDPYRARTPGSACDAPAESPECPYGSVALCGIRQGQALFFDTI